MKKLFYLLVLAVLLPGAAWSQTREIYTNAKFSALAKDHKTTKPWLSCPSPLSCNCAPRR